MDINALTRLIPYLVSFVTAVASYKALTEKTKADKDKIEYNRLIEENNRLKADAEVYRKRWLTAEDELEKLRKKQFAEATRNLGPKRKDKTT